MNYLDETTIARAFVAAIMVAIGAAALVLSGNVGKKPASISASGFVSDGAAFVLADFNELDGWRLDDAAETLPAFLRSCAHFEALAENAPANPSELPGILGEAGASLAGAAGDWRAPCAEATKIVSQPYADKNARTSAARAFYEFHFRPVRIYERLRPPEGQSPNTVATLTSSGRFTAYFEPYYEASPIRTIIYSAPVHARPTDLVTVDLGRFRPELRGQRIAGRIEDGALDPYPDHAAINGGAIVSRARVLAWMRPTDLFFLQIQGSGRLSLPGGEMRVGYDGSNGRPYTAIGRTLIERGALTRETVSMQTIRAWLDGATEEDGRAVRETNESYVFFRALDALPDRQLGPIGAQGVQLTAGRSIAVDPRYTPLGAPVWVSIEGDPEVRRDPVRRLMIAQDTGGAIKGPVRGDIFVGSGPQAGEVAGGYNRSGEMFVLLPKASAERLPKKARA